MSAAFIRGVAITAGVLVSAAVGYVARGLFEKPEREKMQKENESLRTQLRSVLATFEKENDRMESIIEEIVTNPPDTLFELKHCLTLNGLSEPQINRIIAAIRRHNVYGDAA